MILVSQIQQTIAKHPPERHLTQSSLLQLDLNERTYIINIMYVNTT